MAEALPGPEEKHRAQGVNQRFHKYIDQLKASKNPKEARVALSKATEVCDLHAFVYLAFPHEHPAKPPAFVSSYPEAWISRYIGARYDRIDPLIPQLKHSFLPFAWGTAQSIKDWSKPQLRILDEGREFGVRFGITVPIHAPQGRTAALTFASGQQERDFLRSAECHCDLLHLMAIHFHVHAEQLLAPGKLPFLHVSPREIECLQWAARGRTRREVARLIGVTERTVGFHLDNVKRKLAVRSTTEAVAKSIALGLLSL